MKRWSLFVLAFGATLTLAAQKTKNPNLPAYGTVEKADLELKACEFDEKAEAMVLLDEGNLDFVFGKGLEMKRRVRIKIFNTKGLDWANVHLTYLSEDNEQSISGLEAQTYNLDPSGNIVTTSLDKKLVYEKKLNKRFTEKTFTFPGAKVGSVIEYKFKHSGVGLIDWYFQRSIPVRYSHFSMDFPDDIEVSVSPITSPARRIEGNTNRYGNRSSKSYSMSKVPAFRDEPYIINEDYYRDRLETKVVAVTQNGIRKNLVVNWLQVIRFMMADEDFGQQIKKNIPLTAELDEQLKRLPSAYDRMKTVYKYVQNHMEWNEYTGIWAADGVRSAWKDKKGTVGEINLILVNLLKDAGLEAYPILVSTHNNGVVNTVDAGTSDWPGFHQFDKVMAYVELEGKPFVLDASQKQMPAHLIPADVLSTQGLVISKLETFEWGWKNIWKNSLSARNTIMINGEIGTDGQLKGDISISSYDYARLSRIGAARKGNEKYIETYFKDASPGLVVDELALENVDSDSLPLVQKIKFHQTLNSSGDYQYFSANLLTGLKQNPFIAEQRYSDIFFGYNQSYNIIGNFMLPEDYEFEELPKNVKMIMPDTSVSVSRLAQVSNGRLMVRMQVEFKKPVFPASQYGDLQGFFQGMFEVMNEQFVIRKKKKA